MTRLLLRPVLVCIALCLPGSVPAQGSPPHDSIRTTPAAHMASDLPPLVSSMPAGIAPRARCVPPMAVCAHPGTPLPVDDVGRTRGRYAMAGFIVGAGAGALWYAQACSREDCMGPSFGAIVLIAAGGVVGALVGLLLGPSPAP